MARRIKIDQINEEEQLLVRLAWACEIEGLTQAEAAARFGVTRLRVNRALGEARQRGLLRVSIDSVYAAAAETEWRLAERFGIARAVVVPTPADPGSTTALVAAGLGSFLTTLLRGSGITRFGMGWGNTLNLATRHMQPLDRPDLEILSVMGGVARGSDVNCYEITTRLADICNAEHTFFPAPLYAGSAESRALFQDQDVIAEGLARIRSCQAVALATSDLSQSLLSRDALPRDVAAAELIAAGGVGDIIGHVLDADGNLVAHGLNDRVIGISLDDLARIPNVILAAGGTHKTPVIRAALRRGLVDTVVTDENTATMLLDG